MPVRTRLIGVCPLAARPARARVGNMKRNSPSDFRSLDDLSHLDEKLVDKR